MKGLILSGGAGSRLRPITHTSAKQLVPVANKPILFYGLEAMAAAGIQDVGIIVGETGAEVREAVGNGSRWGLRVTFIPQEAPLGLAHCVLIAHPFLGDDDFVMYLGDNLLRHGLGGQVAHFQNRDRGVAAQIMLARVPDPERFGVAELDESGRVIRLTEKPPAPASDLALVGVYLFSPAVHEAVRAIGPSRRGELEITDAIQWLIDQGRPVASKIVDDWWIDTGTLEALLEGNRLILEALIQSVQGKVDAASRIEGRVVIEAGASVERSTVRGPAIIGEGTRVIDSYIGPFTSISGGCEIIGAEIEHSVVLASAKVLGVRRVIDSLIGKEAVVQNSASLPQALRLMVGDHSRVEIPQNGGASS